MEVTSFGGVAWINGVDVGLPRSDRQEVLTRV